MNERELYQRRVYHYLMELRNLFSRCPIDVQTGISEEVLTEVAHLLADGSVFDLVSELAEAQRSEEQVLYKQLMDLRSDQSGERAALRKRHREARSIIVSRPHHLPVLQKEHEHEQQHLRKRQAEATRSLITRIVHALDGRVMEQQTALERTGCSVFRRTTHTRLIRIQMRVLDWIMQLSRHPLPDELRRGPRAPATHAGSTTTMMWPI
ncbi:hypothetical protein FGIG_00861 [Fasciola gigantica]|uniref:Uncharacterized protein n=1 Tax=Fasciola gigantica TaxID=46835 RepID=A0A504Z207_FASGI|nr:hypothetical protein FGIG_00861 [Fasciola gigantica]